MSNSESQPENNFENVMNAARAAHATKAQNAHEARQSRQEAFASELSRLNGPDQDRKRQSDSDTEA